MKSIRSIFFLFAAFLLLDKSVSSVLTQQILVVQDVRSGDLEEPISEDDAEDVDDDYTLMAISPIIPYLPSSALFTNSGELKIFDHALEIVVPPPQG